MSDEQMVSVSRVIDATPEEIFAVIADPSKMTDGRDPQLDAGVEHLLDEIRRNPYRPANRPAEPVRTGVGINEADK